MFLVFILQTFLKIIFFSKKNFTSILTSIFGLTSIFLTSHAQKFQKMQFLEKVPKKYSKNAVMAQFWQIILKVMPKWKLVRNFSKSKTPINTPLSTWFSFCWVCIFLCFICILNIFEKKKIKNKKKISTSILTSIFGLTSIFLTSHAQKFPKMQFLERA